jgi:SNF2 family DNA or RNA helicase
MSLVYDAMRPYQRRGAHFMRRAGSALLADEPGLGKTIQTLGTIVADAAFRYDDKDLFRCWHLIVCPKIAVSNVWRPEITRWLADRHVEVLTLTGSLKSRSQALNEFVPDPLTRHVFVVVNTESLRVRAKVDDLPRKRRDVIRFSKSQSGVKTHFVYAPENGVLPELLQRDWDTVVCDESHRALIRTSNSIPNQTRAGFVLVGERARRRIALSGTPMRGKPEQLWGTLNWLRPDLYRSYWNWIKEFYATQSNGFSDYVLVGFKEGGRAALARSLQPIMLRRTKAEVAPDLPPKTYAGYHLIDGDDQSPLGVWLSMSKDQAAQYAELEAEGVVGDVLVNGALAEYTRRLQIAGCRHDVVDGALVPTLDSPKFEWLLEWLEASGGKKVVVAGRLTSILKRYQTGLQHAGYGAGLIVGGMPESKRDAVVNAFQNGGLQVVLLNTKAGGVALTLDAADYMVFLDESTIPDEQIQTEDRIHRISRNHNVTIYCLRMLDTIEEEVAYIAAARQDVQQYLLDGARGVEYARQVYLMNRNQKEAEK